MSLPRKTLCINVSKVLDLQKRENIDFSNLLRHINMSNKTFKSILKNHSTKKEYYLKRKINDDLVTKISKLNLPYIYFIDEYQRVYLGGTYFSNIIGFTDIDNKNKRNAWNKVSCKTCLRT